MTRLPSTPRRAPFAIRHPLSAILYPLLFAALTASAFAKSPMNIVLILVDDLGWTDLSCQGSTYY